MGNCFTRASTPSSTHVIALRTVTPYTNLPEFLLYKKVHPLETTPNPRHMLRTLQLSLLCDSTQLSLPKGRTSLSTLQSQLGDALVGIHVLQPVLLPVLLPVLQQEQQQEPAPTSTSTSAPSYRLLANDHVLLQGEASPEPSLFVTPTTPSLFFYTTQAAENPDGLTVLTEALPLYALSNTDIVLELSESATVVFYTVYYPPALLDATKNKKGKLQLQGHGWLYDPTAPAPAFFPDLPF